MLLFVVLFVGIVIEAATPQFVRCACYDLDKPVCDSKGVTQTNECFFECFKRLDPTLTIAHEGPCK